jgi:two-component system cell cycle sensor histidine kinase/response regulator CckA
MQTKDSIDLVLIDVIMPRKDGRDVYDTIMQVKPTAKILFMSGYNHDMLEQKGLDKPGIHFIKKPIPPSKLLKKIRILLDAS